MTENKIDDPAPEKKERKKRGYISRLFKVLRGKESAEIESPAEETDEHPAVEETMTATAHEKEAPKEETVSQEDQKPKVAARPRKKTRPSKQKKPRTDSLTAREKTETAREKTEKAKVEKKTTEEPRAKNVVQKLLINTEEPEECRIALLENGKVESFHVQTVVWTQTKGNIYKGKIVSVEPNLQAAFVDIGTEKNGFLPFSDIHPEYYCKDVPPDTHWKALKIQDVIRKGQEVLLEVVKEPTGNKGANMTTYLSLPGRFTVLMPGSDSHGISRKLDDDTRSKLRKMVGSLNLPEGIGYIIRTASKNATKTSLSKDLKYLLNLWQEIKNLGQSESAPALIYKEQNIISRFLRDHFTSDIKEILVDSEDALKQVKSFLDLFTVRQKKTIVKQHKGSRPIFNSFNVEDQIEQIYQSTVSLPSGGSIVISPTEALVAVDVNSGRTSKDRDFESSIFLANMEAAEELARQLRLRDLGGLIVVDFIDMRVQRNIREVEKKMKASMKRDKAKIDISRISKFGLMQISRQRLGPPVQTGSYRVCDHCQGRGVVQSVETQVLVYLRRIQTGVTRKNVKRVECCFPIEIAQYMLNRKRSELAELEAKNDVNILIVADPAMTPLQEEIDFLTE